MAGSYFKTNGYATSSFAHLLSKGVKVFCCNKIGKGGWRNGTLSFWQSPNGSNFFTHFVAG